MARALAAACLLSLAPRPGALELPTFLASNMVLPRAPASARIWGTARPGDTVEVLISRGGSAKKATAAADGSWAVELDPQPAGTGYQMTVLDGEEYKVLTNLAFGDLWLCSGQSNMEFSVNDAFDDGQQYIDDSENRRIRLATVAKVAADEPLSNTSSKAPDYVWSQSRPWAFSPVGKHFSWPSAVCYFFGLNLFKKMGGSVPLGLVDSAWGGQTVEAFSSPDALADKTCGGAKVPADVLRGEAEDNRSPEPNPGPSQLWNGMIHPLLNFKFTGVLWYQGEANAGDPASYACRFPAMIADWRKKFDQDFAFLFVLLAANRQNFAEIRNAQMAALQLPRTGYATATDLGDPSSPEGPIHPRRKFEVGRRLALAAAHIQYGHKDLGVGPRFKAVRREASDELVVTFEEGTADGLHSHPTAACEEMGSKRCCEESPFEVEVNGTWSRVDLWVLNGPTTVELWGNRSNATALRFNWEGYPQCTLYNGMDGPDDHHGIAATPFKVELPKRRLVPKEILV